MSERSQLNAPSKQDSSCCDRTIRARIVLSQQEESCLLGALSCDLSDIALFLLHTGLREGELRSLRWDMEEESHDGVLVFRLPAEVTKNNQDRLVLCNCVAARVIRRRREFDSDWIFANADGSRRRARLSSSGQTTTTVLVVEIHLHSQKSNQNRILAVYE